MTRDQLGMIARDALINWENRQLNPREDQLIPYKDLSDYQKEAYREMGQAVSDALTAEHERKQQELRDALDWDLDNQA